MDKSIMDFNIGSYDRASRCLVGLLSLITLMSMNSVPPMFALLPLYPILTGIAAWDPVYAVLAELHKVIKGLFNINNVKEGKLALP